MRRLFALLSAAVMLCMTGCADSGADSVPVSETTALTVQTTAATTVSTANSTETTGISTKAFTTKNTSGTVSATTETAVILETAPEDAEDAPPVADEFIPDYAQYYEDDGEEYDYEEDPELPDWIEDGDVEPEPPKQTSAVTKKATTAPRTGSVTAKTTAVTVKSNAKPTNSVPEMDKIAKKYGSKCAVMLYSMDGTVLYSYNPNTMISGASLIKLPYVVFCCQQLEKGVRSLSESLKYTSSFYHGGSGIIRKNGYGKSYTISQLIDYALRYSDNVAYDMLVYLFGTKGFNDMVKGWGYSVSISAYHRFPPVSANFMRTAMEIMHAHANDAKCWKTAWQALNGSTVSRVREQLGTKNGQIAVKYGCIAAQYHETCYVDGDAPYILVILSPATNYKPDVTYLKNIAKTAAKIVNEHEAAKLTATTTTTTTTTVTTTTETTTSTVATTTETTAETDLSAVSADSTDIPKETTEMTAPETNLPSDTTATENTTD